MTENLPSDRATKPGDVLTIRNGMTIEVLNTDAEGRLILADGLSLAVEVNPDAIVDVARSLVPSAWPSVMKWERFSPPPTSWPTTLRRELAQRRGVVAHALVEKYESTIESDVADMKNMGKPGNGGMIAAALILQRFTDGRPWAHIDIAGPGRSDAHRGYTTKGATAFSARTIVEFLEAVAEEARD